MKYNKLIRDMIPNIIADDGKIASYRYAKDYELKEYLENKLIEEVAEFIKEKNIEELADILEVLVALTENLGYMEEQLYQIREKKRFERGGFDKGIVLMEVENDV